MTIVTDFLGRLGRGAWGTTKTLSGLSNPLSAGYQMGSMSYPFVKDAEHPGAAENRAGLQGSIRNAYRQQFDEERARLGIPALAGQDSPKPMSQLAQRPMPNGSTVDAPTPMQQAMQGPMPNGATMDDPNAPQGSGRPRVMINGGTQMPPPMQEAMGVPMPQERPPEAPQPQAPQQDIGWFMRNAYNQRDPQTGDTIDPAMAQKYEAKNPFAGLFG